ncbi:hypothetical protein [Tropicimonas sediminicola]|uniref:Uncharacterized protein n=1 Tax=Tropicimonas sediminicola TaxID=1031541 RepID=A0A239EPM6_9RHOB|nr:hypothetical protein [Tropicimonas sediminicola]SNS46529.1 hypothetical protein SAMN05421757_102263 [Tropicimonas sediminicola]
MDGRLLLVGCVGILGGAWLLGSEEITLGPSGGPSTRVEASSHVVDLRHNEIRQTLLREGYDLDDPASYVRQRDGSRVVGGPVAATEHGRPVFIESVMAGYHRPVVSEAPGKVTEARVIEECRFTAPAAGARVANVFSNASLHGASFYAFDMPELDPLALRYLETQSEQGETPPSGMLSIAAKIAEKATEMQSLPSLTKSGGFQYKVTEVVVTETEMPVHLVLQAGAGRVLWNLHLAEGAEVSGVSLLGGHLPAVANVPKRVPVEVLDDAGLAACGVTRVRLPLASDPIFAAVDEGALTLDRARAGLEDMRQQAEAWNGWFEGQFGLRSDQSRIGFEEAAIMAVVGPLPETPEARVVHHTLRRASVAMAPAEEVFAKDPGAAETRVGRLAIERAEVLTAQAAALTGTTN